jgi:hypothetical protein
MKRIAATLIFCLLAGTGVFFTVNHAARAQAIVAMAGELPNIPGCPLHESCVKALREERSKSLPRFPAAGFGGLAGMGAMAGAAFLLAKGKRWNVLAAGR